MDSDAAPTCSRRVALIDIENMMATSDPGALKECENRLICWRALQVYCSRRLVRGGHAVVLARPCRIGEIESQPSSGGLSSSLTIGTFAALLLIQEGGRDTFRWRTLFKLVGALHLFVPHVVSLFLGAYLDGIDTVMAILATLMASYPHPRPSDDQVKSEGDHEGQHSKTNDDPYKHVSPGCYVMNDPVLVHLEAAITFAIIAAGIIAPDSYGGGASYGFWLVVDMGGCVWLEQSSIQRLFIRCS